MKRADPKRQSSAPSTQSGTVGAGTPAAPVVTTNARESLPTTAEHRTPVEGARATPALSHDTATRVQVQPVGAAIARAILATLAPDTAAALLVLLVQWLRGVLCITGPTPEARQHAAELSADRVTESAGQLGAREHAVAIVAALVGLTPDEAVDGLYCEPFNPCMPTELREALDALGAIDADALAAPHPATASGLDGAHGARVLRASLSSARGIATRALMNAAADADDAAAVDVLRALDSEGGR